LAVARRPRRLRHRYPLWLAAGRPERLSPSLSPRRRPPRDVIDQPARVQFEVFLDEHRSELNGCLDGLSEEQVRRSLVPSRTTLLGLVKHATFVEKVWFDEAVTCRSRAEIGIPADPDTSFILDDTDTIATVRQAQPRGVRVIAPRDRHPWGWTTCFSVIAAAHSRCAGPTFTCCANSHSTAGHADILREQLISEPPL